MHGRERGGSGVPRIPVAGEVVLSSSGKSLRAVSFDGDGTLWEVLGAPDDALVAVAAAINQGQPAGASIVEVSHLEAARAQAERMHPGWSMNSLRRQSFADLLDTYQVVGVSLDDLWAGFLGARWARTRLFDDAIPVLRRLRDCRIRTCLLSNGNTLPENVGLEGLFDHAQVAEDVGVHKPDPAAFAMAAAGLGCSPDTILHVGNEECADFAGALKAGFRAVLLCRTSPIVAGSILSLSAIPDIVDESKT